MEPLVHAAFSKVLSPAKDAGLFSIRRKSIGPQYGCGTPLLQTTTPRRVVRKTPKLRRRKRYSTAEKPTDICLRIDKAVAEEWPLFENAALRSNRKNSSGFPEFPCRQNKVIRDFIRLSELPLPQERRTNPSRLHTLTFRVEAPKPKKVLNLPSSNLFTLRRSSCY